MLKPIIKKGGEQYIQNTQNTLKSILNIQRGQNIKKNDKRQNIHTWLYISYN